MAICTMEFLLKCRCLKRKPLVHGGELRGHILNQNVTYDCICQYLLLSNFGIELGDYG